MRNKIKSYLVFTSDSYIILVLILAPILLGLGELFVASWLGYGASIFSVFMYVMIDVFSDHWVLGGICSKEFGGIAYVQSSTNGIRFMKNALQIDIARRAIWYAVLGIFFATIDLFMIEGTGFAIEMVLFYTNIVLLCYVFSTVGILFTRFFQNYGICMMGAYGAAIFAMLGITYTSLTSMNLGIIVAIETVAAIGVSVLLFGINMKKVKGSYYDQAD